MHISQSTPVSLSLHFPHSKGKEKNGKPSVTKLLLFVKVMGSEGGMKIILFFSLYDS